tara:strand:- start:727 stop:1275 length:549 start_codon:yes stop_codon:yes gene_type:complete
MKKDLIEMLQKYSYRKGNFTLSSGSESEHYVNCKPVTLMPKGLDLVSMMMLDHIDDNVSAVAGLTLGADPLVSGVIIQSNLWNKRLESGLIIRKEPKGHGTASQIEGPLPPSGSRVAVLEDVTTTGGSAMKAVNVLRDSGYKVDCVVTIVDRKEGAEELFKENGIKLRSLVTVDDLDDGSVH